MKTRVPLFDLIRCLSGTAGLVSRRMAGHQLRTAYIAGCLAEELGLAAENGATLILAVAIHGLDVLSPKGRGGCGGAAERGPAQAGCGLLRDCEPLAAAAEVAWRCGEPWNFGRPGPGGPAPEESCLLHLADRAAVLAARGGAGRCREGELRDGAGEVFVPAHTEAFSRLAGRESFRLDLASGALPSLLAEKVKEHGVMLGLEEIRQLGAFFSRVIALRSPFTASHSSGVAACAQALAGLAGFSPERCVLMGVAGQMHDLGKLAVPRRILQKDGPLSAGEAGAVRAHAYHTYRILKTVPALAEVTEWAALHHERLDGGGYPFRRKAARLCVGSRIMSVADVYSALSEDRPYRRSLPRSAALSIMRGMAKDSALDAALVDLLEKNCGEIEHRRLLSQERREALAR